MGWRIAVLAFMGMVAWAQAAPIERAQVHVKDGDTIIIGDGKTSHARGDEYRLIGFDTPEVSRAKCPSEYERGIRASARLIELLDGGGVLDLTEIPCSCQRWQVLAGTCNRGRRCGRLTVNGKDVGDVLIAEGHAAPYICTPTKCPRMTTWC